MIYDLKYLSQEFDINVLDLVKQKGFYQCEYMSDFEKFKEELSSEEKFHSSLADKKISDKEYEHILKAYVHYFLSNFYFSPNDSPSKAMKNAFCF